MLKQVEIKETKRSFLPPGPKSNMPGDQLFAFRRDPLKYLVTLAKEYGDICHFHIGLEPLTFINHPDYIRDVLVTHEWNFLKGRGLQRGKRLLGEGLLTSEGNLHRRQRRLSQPAFHHQRIAAYAEIMTRYASKMRGEWKQGETLDIAQEMHRLTLAIVGKTLFDADVEFEAREIGEALAIAVEMFSFLTLPFSEILEKLPLPQMRRFDRARDRLDATIQRMIAERRASGGDRGDLLSMLLMAQDNEGSGGMSDEQLRDEAMTLFLAGHETTANALTWTWYLLSQNPEVEAKLHEELDTVLAGRTPTMEDVAKLKYTEMVFTESMRLYPPAWALGRKIVTDYKIGDYILPKHTTIIMSQYVMHRDARYYQAPDQFEPERWRPECREKLPKFAYFPFGGGSRLCIGEPFAWMEGVLVIATLAQQWQMRLMPGHPVALLPRITLRPQFGMKMIMTARANCSS